MMRLKTAPYKHVRAFLWGEEIIGRDRRYKVNPLHWDRVEQNLRGDSNYNPRLLWTDQAWRSKLYTSDALCWFNAKSSRPARCNTEDLTTHSKGIRSLVWKNHKSSA
eukprot:15350394-Ditylum_brightwellii.AAC.1